MRGMGTLGRALGVAWRRSLQLRVLALTLGMSLAPPGIIRIDVAEGAA